MIFTGTFVRNLDEKNRIQIPAEFRKGRDPKVDGKAFYLSLGETKHTLSLYPPGTFEARARALQEKRIAGDDSLAFEQVFYPSANRLEMDPQGRVVLPERQLAMVHLGKEITLAGANDRIDLWRTAEYEEFARVTYEHRWHELHKYWRLAGSEWKEKDPPAVV
jgi:MraZ protein